MLLEMETRKSWKSLVYLPFYNLLIVFVVKVSSHLTALNLTIENIKYAINLIIEFIKYSY